MNNQTIALNVAEVDKYMLDILDCSNKVKTLFNKIDDEIAKVKQHYSCSAADVLYRQYEEFNDNYKTVVANILSYSSDLKSLKKTYLNTMSDLSQELRKDAADLIGKK